MFQLQLLHSALTMHFSVEIFSIGSDFVLVSNEIVALCSDYAHSRRSSFNLLKLMHVLLKKLHLVQTLRISEAIVALGSDYPHNI